MIKFELIKNDNDFYKFVKDPKFLQIRFIKKNGIFFKFALLGKFRDLQILDNENLENEK